MYSPPFSPLAHSLLHRRRGCTPLDLVFLFPPTSRWVSLLSLYSPSLVLLFTPPKLCFFLGLLKGLPTIRVASPLESRFLNFYSPGCTASCDSARQHFLLCAFFKKLMASTATDDFPVFLSFCVGPVFFFIVGGASMQRCYLLHFSLRSCSPSCIPEPGAAPLPLVRSSAFLLVLGLPLRLCLFS